MHAHHASAASFVTTASSFSSLAGGDKAAVADTGSPMDPDGFVSVSPSFSQAQRSQEEAWRDVGTWLNTNAGEADAAGVVQARASHGHGSGGVKAAAAKAVAGAGVPLSKAAGTIPSPRQLPSFPRTATAATANTTAATTSSSSSKPAGLSDLAAAAVLAGGAVGAGLGGAVAAGAAPTMALRMGGGLLAAVSSYGSWLVGSNPTSPQGDAPTPRRTQEHLIASSPRRTADSWDSSYGGTDTTGAIAAEDSEYLLVPTSGNELAEQIKGVLLWRDVGLSAKVLGLGLYIILLLHSIPAGLAYFQPTTVFPGVALVYLSYNLIKPLGARWYARMTSTPRSQVRRSVEATERALLARTTGAAAGAAEWVGRYIGASLLLAHSALRGRRFTPTVWTVAALWMLMLLSELRLLPPVLMSMFAFSLLFAVPWLYYCFKAAMDSFVYEALHFMAAIVLQGERWAYALASVAALGIWSLLESEHASLVVRTTLAGSAALAVLVWRASVA